MHHRLYLEKLNILLSFMSTPFVILEIQTLFHKALKYRCLPISKTYTTPRLTNLLYSQFKFGLCCKKFFTKDAKILVLDCKTPEPNFKRHLPASHQNHHFNNM